MTSTGGRGGCDNEGWKEARVDVMEPIVERMCGTLGDFWQR